MIARFLPVPALRPIQWLLGSGASFTHPGSHVALTFDDGPHPERTPRVLDLLRRHRIRATFFVVGERALAHPEIIERMVGEGHQLGNHGWSHRWLPGAARPELAAEVERCQEAVEKLSGKAPTLVRPAFGWFPPAYVQRVRACGLRLVLWSVDSLDWAGVPGRWVSFRAGGARAGDVLLFHDGSTWARGTLEGLERWLARAGARGLSIGPFSTSETSP
jgi:peptidoglycan-N-acetylglucosamine deacetylase